MKIKKIGHCCLIIEVNGVKIMTDPGNYTDGQDFETGINYILVTHEHLDHIHINSLKKVLENNVYARIVTNSSVKKLLEQHGIYCQILEEGEFKFPAFNLFAKTCPHVEIFPSIAPVQNTGYLVDNKLFYPGDAWLEIDQPVKILALPVAGPWCKMVDSLQYAIRVNPQFVIPVHDGMIKEKNITPFRSLPEKILKDNKINFLSLNDGEEIIFNI